jgi:hypothetical protein
MLGDTFGANFLSLHSAKMQAVLRDTEELWEGGRWHGVSHSNTFSIPVRKLILEKHCSAASLPLGPQKITTDSGSGQSFSQELQGQWLGTMVAAETCPFEIVLVLWTRGRHGIENGNFLLRRNISLCAVCVCVRTRVHELQALLIAPYHWVKPNICRAQAASFPNE